MAHLTKRRRKTALSSTSQSDSSSDSELTSITDEEKNDDKVNEAPQPQNEVKKVVAEVKVTNEKHHHQAQELRQRILQAYAFEDNARLQRLIPALENLCVDREVLSKSGIGYVVNSKPIWAALPVQARERLSKLVLRWKKESNHGKRCEVTQKFDCYHKGALDFKQKIQELAHWCNVQAQHGVDESAVREVCLALVNQGAHQWQDLEHVLPREIEEWFSSTHCKVFAAKMVDRAKQMKTASLISEKLKNNLVHMVFPEKLQVHNPWRTHWSRPSWRRLRRRCRPSYFRQVCPRLLSMLVPVWPWKECRWQCWQVYQFNSWLRNVFGSCAQVQDKRVVVWWSAHFAHGTHGQEHWVTLRGRPFHRVRLHMWRSGSHWW